VRPGTVKNGELSVRCPFCGDSSNLKTSHLRINLKSGLYHCHRCSQGGILSAKEMLSLGDQSFDVSYEFHEKKPTIYPGPGSERSSLLKRYHTESGEDAFYNYAPSHNGFYHSGVYMRGKKSHFYGDSGISWVGAPTGLRSDPTSPLRLVEGPYDVVTDRDVCLFGYLGQKKLGWMKGHNFYLVPDGDVWIKPDLTRLLLSKVEYCIRNSLGLMGVIFLKANADPDDLPEEEIIPIRYFRRKLWIKRSSSSKARLALANLD